jgi:5-methylcytosine-specific restriction endonuclease McrA
MQAHQQNQKSQSLPQPPMPSVLQNSVVVFSKNYLPLSRINIKRAITLLVTGQAESLEFSSSKGWQIRSPNIVLYVPEHIRLTMGNPGRIWKIPPVNRRELLRRDNHTCQYCGSTRNLTIDHLIPRSKGGAHTWDNVVTACGTCNGQKGDRLLSETGMILQAKPKAPIHPAIAFAERFWKEQESEEQQTNLP